MSLFYCTCVVALWTISLKSLVDVLCINFNNVEGLSLFLLLVWGVVSKKFSSLYHVRERVILKNRSFRIKVKGGLSLIITVRNSAFVRAPREQQQQQSSHDSSKTSRRKIPPALTHLPFISARRKSVCTMREK